MEILRNQYQQNQQILTDQLEKLQALWEELLQSESIAFDILERIQLQIGTYESSFLLAELQKRQAFVDELRAMNSQLFP